MSAALSEATARLQALREHHARAVADASQRAPAQDRIDELNGQIAQARADAYLTGAKLDTSALERELKAAQQAGAAAAVARDAAQAAAQVLAERIQHTEEEIAALTLQEHSAALERELAAYTSERNAYSDQASALLTSLATVLARAIVVERLSGRVGRRALELGFVTDLLVHRLQITMEARPGEWRYVDSWEQVSEQASALVAQRAQALQAIGVELEGPSLVPAREPAPAVPSEPRHVQILVDGKAPGPRLLVAGLVDSVEH